ncbi:MAG: flavodoxin family protein [Turicibacter sp.]|nr:flavodoxin family protein [Turicibacter sp.]
MKIVGIVGSLRKGGNTEFVIQEALKCASALGMETEAIKLAEYTILPCNGCGICKENPCPIDDDMNGLLSKLSSADAILFASPVYYGGISGGLKCFMDRCRPLKQQGNQLNGKLGGAIAVGKVWGHISVIDTMLHFFGSQGIRAISIGSNPGVGVQVIASEKGAAANDAAGIKALNELCNNIARVLKK